MTLITTDVMINFARDALGIPGPEHIEIVPLAVRGSDRNFFRVKWNHTYSSILINYNPDRTENKYYADIAVFLHDIRVAVPRLISHEPEKCLMLLEDMGDIDLWAFKNVPWEDRRALYQKTLVVMHRLHSYPVKDFPSGRIKLMEAFGPALYQWEREYFKDYFVNAVCGIKLNPVLEKELDAELSALAERFSEDGTTLVHRDFQSQNVMIREGQPFLIDFQGMRFGNPLYDLGSLLCDPYITFTDDEIHELLTFYCVLASWDLDWETFAERFWGASAQRLMQALGAYGFLAYKKGLRDFLKHIPAGLHNLNRASSNVATLPRLFELTGICMNVLEQTTIPQA